ncbi:MAG: class I SAM-dependent methyltransferase [Bacteriovoracia bacterium]
MFSSLIIAVLLVLPDTASSTGRFRKISHLVKAPVWPILEENGVRTRKLFQPIAKEYDFFLEHSDEPTETRRLFHEQVDKYPVFRVPTEPLRILDFGSGDGQLLEYLITHSETLKSTDPFSFEISIVEPSDYHRALAKERLKKYSSRPIKAWKTLPDSIVDQFHYVFVNHVLYYVPDIKETFLALFRAMASHNSYLFFTMEETDGPFAQYWEDIFIRELGDPFIPYHRWDDVYRFLREAKVLGNKKKSRWHQLVSHTRFEDTIPNRLQICRFLLSEHTNRVGLTTAADILGDHGKIVNNEIDFEKPDVLIVIPHGEWRDR